MADMRDLYKAEFDEGNLSAPLNVAVYCFEHDLDVPPWAKNALGIALRGVRSLDAASWDDVFGKPHKGRKLSRLRAEKNLRWKIFLRVHFLRRQRPKPKDIFQIVADENKISRTTCKRYFDKIRKPT